MDWLDKIVDDYEAKKQDQKQKYLEEKRKEAQVLKENHEKVSLALDIIYKYFLTIKNNLNVKKYPCEVEASTFIAGETRIQYNKEVTLVVRRNEPTNIKKISRLESPYISFAAQQGSENLIIKKSITTDKTNHYRVLNDVTELVFKTETLKFISDLLN